MKKLLPYVLLLLSFGAYSQQDPLFSQYMFNKLLVNPAYAGSKEVLAVDILDRYQWVGIDGAPRTFTFAAHSALRNRKIGLGFYVYRDALGPLINQGFMGTYSYRIIMDRGILSFGLQAGFKFFDYTWLQEYTLDPDFVFERADIQRFAPDANFGIYYYTDYLFAGVSSKQLFETEYGLVSIDGKQTYTRLSRHFYGMFGGAIVLSDDLVFRPSMLIKYVRNAPMQVDFNASMIFNDMFWLGASYRTEQAVVLLTEFRITRNIRVGYSFDMYLNELQGHNRGTHEIRLGLDFELFQSRMLTPRYFF